MFVLCVCFLLFFYSSIIANDELPNIAQHKFEKYRATSQLPYVYQNQFIIQC